MKIKKLILYFLLLVSASCSNQINNNETNSVFKKYVKTVPPYAPFINTPEDTLLLGFNKGSTNDDTSWNLMVNKTNVGIQGRYNYILPYTITGFHDFLDDSTNLLYYEGFTFEIGMKKWNNIVSSAGLDKYLPKDTLAYTGCLHCP